MSLYTTSATSCSSGDIGNSFTLTQVPNSDMPCRYAFRSTEKVSLQEIGPRFTLKLRTMRKGIPAVKNFGEAPKPLEFDTGEDEEQADVPEGGEEEKKQTVLPPKEDEFLWAWKVSCLAVDGNEHMLILCHSPSWRHLTKHSSCSSSNSISEHWSFLFSSACLGRTLWPQSDAPCFARCAVIDNTQAIHQRWSA